MLTLKYNSVCVCVCEHMHLDEVIIQIQGHLGLYNIQALAHAKPIPVYCVVISCLPTKCMQCKEGKNQCAAKFTLHVF